MNLRDQPSTRPCLMLIAAATRTGGLLYLAAGLIAGATPASAQTLPFYNDLAWCIAEAPKHIAKMSKELRGSQSEQKIAEQVYVLHTAVEKSVRDELVKHWDSHDSSIRLQCIATKSVINYTSLQKCIEDMEKKIGYSPQLAEAARRAKAVEERLKQQQSDLALSQLTLECRQLKQSKYSECDNCTQWMSTEQCNEARRTHRKCDAAGLWNYKGPRSPDYNPYSCR